MKGKLINFEGIDGSGKGTQSAILHENLKESGVESILFSFPCYDKTFFGKEIGAFLRGEFGGIDQVHPKLASILYAMDRAEMRDKIIHSLDDGKIVICDRYVDSNIAHQVSKLPDGEKLNFIKWIEELEYGINKMPLPDLTFFLDVPIAVSKKMVLKKNQRSYTESSEDIHEKAHGYLQKVYDAYLSIDYGIRWRKIQCCDGLIMKSTQDISKNINSIINKEVFENE
ncbi:dTMP kinase [Pectobacterium zantedeschiae]|uniref:dTMP kinase n=1 Tax=Pectobacterium zantedeschiae TaxID=2034769 RepID=UPI00375477B6